MDVGKSQDLEASLPGPATGKAGQPYFLARWLFLRLMGAVYFMAFLSLISQISGLVGSHGILPAHDFLQAAYEALGPLSYWLFPTLAWLNCSDGFLQLLAVGGACLSLLVVLGIGTAPILVLLWVFYLSLVTVGRDFLSFQWDALLLEAGFLSIFFAPWKLLSPPWQAPAWLLSESPPSPILLWLFRWLLFRVTFMSGAVKLLSGDPTWRDLTAVSYHYTTQPLPTPVAWYVSQLPMWFQRFSCAGMFILELLVPLLIFAPRRLRFLGAGLICFLQVLIAVTGNYTFFNLLTIFLCLLLLDDALLRRLFPRVLADRILQAGTASMPYLQRACCAPLAVLILFLSGVEVLEQFVGMRSLPRAVAEIVGLVSPFQIANPYGVFAVMTTTRLEIIIEGSDDGEVWSEYEFKYKPGDPKRPPPWVAPHQPRLDWQMWFAALGSYRSNPWFVGLMRRLLQGSPDVLALLETNPFPSRPPRFVRAIVYDYHFSDFAGRNATGKWWRRDYRGTYFPVASLTDSRKARIKEE